MSASRFQLNTSGEIWVDLHRPGPPVLTSWCDLTPFAQGYVEAMLGSRVAVKSPVDGRPLVLGFRHLAPATLARIIEDCEAQQCLMRSMQKLDGMPDDLWREAGRRWWPARQLGGDNDFPPLTPYLADDGLIYFREAKQ